MSKQALISVFNKAGAVELAKALSDAGFKVISTGGTATSLTQEGVKVTQVSEITDFPEILEGRVKTLHPKIHGGILAKTNVDKHVSDLKTHNISPIQVVAVNLYPFVETIKKEGTTLDVALENIDIGGVTLIRAAAKNFPHVIILVDPQDYKSVSEKIRAGGVESVTLSDRHRLALKAFQHVCAYDSAISDYLLKTKVGGNGIANAELVQGTPLSYNNILDAEACYKAIKEFQQPGCVIVKHTNPCGLALHDDQKEAYNRAFSGDSVSAYGGIVGFNTVVTVPAVEAMKGVFYEVMIAPDYEPAALEILSKRQKLRVLKLQNFFFHPTALEIKTVSGGVLLQSPNPLIIDSDAAKWQVVTEAKPTDEQMKDLLFAWKISKHVKSNAIVLVKDNTLVGMGAGQPNRLQSIHISLKIAGEKAKGSVLASDAFMPFPDNVELAVQGGITAIVQPGGSIRDKESIEAANKAGIPMLFTGNRNFLH